MADACYSPCRSSTEGLRNVCILERSKFSHDWLLVRCHKTIQSILRYDVMQLLVANHVVEAVFPNYEVYEKGIMLLN